MATEWADKYKGVFDDGWDAYREKTFARQKELGIAPADAELSRHDPDVPDWDSLSAPVRQLYSRMMEVFAGFLSHTDHQVGRLLDFLAQQGELENTLIMVISDNGASAEGGPTGTTNEAQFFNNAQEPIEESLKLIDEIGGPKHFNHYPWGWTFAGNTPFRRWKRETYRGGACDPFLVSWPKGITSKGEIRGQYAHIIDMVPTVLDLLGIEPPAAVRGVAQSPMHGVSFAHTLGDPEAETRHHTQYFEMIGHRAIYHDGWRAVCPWPGPSFAEAGTGLRRPHLGGEAVRARRDRLGALPRRRGLRGDHERRGREPRPADRDDRHLVRGGRKVRRHADRRQRPRPHHGREAADRVAARSLHLPAEHAVDPELRRAAGAQPPAQHHRGRRDPRDGAEGVLLSQGTAAGGYSFYVKDGKLRYVHNYVGRQLLEVESEEALPAGKHELRFEFEPTGEPDLSQGKGAPGRLQLYVDGTLVGNAEAAVDDAVHVQPRPLTCGANPGSPVTPDYEGPFTFTGTLHSVTLDVSGELIHDPEAELRVHLARQ